MFKLRDLVREILELSSKSAILADPKSRVFCAEYAKLNRHENEGAKLLNILAQDFGFQPDRIYDSVWKNSSRIKTEVFRWVLKFIFMFSNR